jgi:hypothetical protein
MEYYEIQSEIQETPEPELETFNTLKKLQSLLKKESSLKELCK